MEKFSHFNCQNNLFGSFKADSRPKMASFVAILFEFIAIIPNFVQKWPFLFCFLSLFLPFEFKELISYAAKLLYIEKVDQK